MTRLTREDLIAAARNASAKASSPLSRADFERISSISQHHIYRLFPDGGWVELTKLAGIPKHPQRHKRLTDDELLVEVHSVVTELGRFPTWPQFNSRAQISSDVVRKRFGSRERTEHRYRAWLGQREPGTVAPDDTAPEEPEGRRPSRVPATAHVSASATAHRAHYGAPIDFRGLRHAPINELGVVLLFGMVCRELGFAVEAVHAAFPDCEAKRCIDRKRERWVRVKIEFEFKSRAFRDHRHDLAECDLIVCWEHNWPECPLEVVELKHVIETM